MDSTPTTKTLTWKSFLSSLFGLFILLAILAVVYFLAAKLLTVASGMNPTIAISVVTASTTIIVSTVTVMAGRYYERKKELDALYRDKKTAVYDEFLTNLFKQIHDPNPNQGPNQSFVDYLRDYYRKMILWTGPEALRAYSEWHKLLVTQPSSAQAILKMEQFFLAVRSDLGHSNKGLKEGDILRLILNDADLLLAAAKVIPNITMGQLNELLKQQQLANEAKQAVS